MKITLISPENGAAVEVLTQNQKSFLENRKHIEIIAENADWLNLVKKGEEDSLPLPIVLEWQYPKEDVEFCLTLSEKNDMSGGKSLICKECRCELYHLYLGRTYYWQVSAKKKGETVAVSDIRAFTVSARTPRMIRAEGLSNVRDIGGYPCAGGRRVKQGLIYRGCEMEFHHTITEDGIRVLRDELGIRTDLDLRIEAVGNVVKSALGDTVDLQLIPTVAYEQFFEDKGTCLKLFMLLLDRERYPFYAHCWGGADRTGTLILVILAMLGVDAEYLYEDYELTSLSIWGKRSVTSHHFVDLLAALEKYGNEGDSINTKCINFLRSCGITDEEMDIIRDIMTEPIE